MDDLDALEKELHELESSEPALSPEVIYDRIRSLCEALNTLGEEAEKWRRDRDRALKLARDLSKLAADYAARR